jgi:hypothetical protein
VRLVVPFAACSATDSIARVVAQALIARLAQPVIVDPKHGAGRRRDATRDVGHRCGERGLQGWRAQRASPLVAGDLT